MFKRWNKSKSTPATRTASLIFTIVVLVAVAVMLFIGNQDPKVNILDDHIEIKAMYGRDIPFSEITGITLLEENMNAVGVGDRTNGYGGLGQTLKGNFKSNSLGETLLFVQAASAPTIQIERKGERTVFISFKESAATQALYEELASAFAAK